MLADVAGSVPERFTSRNTEWTFVSRVENEPASVVPMNARQPAVAPATSTVHEVCSHAARCPRPMPGEPAVRAAGQRLTCEPAQFVPLAQRYGLF